ncbi:MAG: trehalose-phosphatase, partial [Planctomycetota bacterium]
EHAPEQRAEIFFVLVAVPSRSGIEEYDWLLETVQREVSAINGAYGSIGHAPVQFLYQSFPQPELAALYALADACLVTPLIDGMNLVAKEYIACKVEAPESRTGVLILSEFAGAAQEMSQALLVNPHDVRETSAAIGAALSMPEDEKVERAEWMGRRIAKSDSAAWARAFLARLDEGRSAPEGGDAPNLVDAVAQMLEAASDVERPAALFLDYDGTLRDFVPVPEDAVPDPGLRPLLSKLAAQPGMHVCIVSGRPASFLEEHFKGAGLTLVAEHGYRWLRDGADDWELVHERVDTSWRDVVRPHLEQAADQTPGATIEEKRSSVVWHYRRADPEFGAWQARGLLEELTDVTANLPVSVHHGKMIVEVASQLVNKGQAVKALMDDWKPQVALAAGDDQTDESMFELDVDGDVTFATVKVGPGSTRAKRRTDIAGLRSFLEYLANRI